MSTDFEKVEDVANEVNSDSDVESADKAELEDQSKNAMKRDKRWDDYVLKRAEIRKNDREKRKRKRQEKVQETLEANGGVMPVVVKDGSMVLNKEYPFKYMDRHPKQILEYIRDDVCLDLKELNKLYMHMHNVGFSIRSEGDTLPEKFPEFFRVPTAPAVSSYNPMNPGKPSMSPTIVIDCGHEDKMIPKEVYSLVKQLSYCYGAMARAVAPCKLLVCGVKEVGITSEQLLRYEGHDQWTWKIEKKPMMDVLTDPNTGNLDHLVYLTAESDNVLDTIDPNMTYIIGGIVDHNRLKGYAQEYATERKIKTARLPIDQHMANGQRSVLTIVNVVELLLARQTMSWREAMVSILPKRWKWSEKTDTETPAPANEK